MRILRSTPALWAAVVLMLIAALAPTASRLLASSASQPQRAFLQEICGAYAGFSSLASSPDAGRDDGDPAPLKSAMACPYCLLQAGLAQLPQALAPVAPALLPLYFLSRLFHLAPSPLLAWVNAWSRAPPA